MNRRVGDSGWVVQYDLVTGPDETIATGTRWFARYEDAIRYLRLCEHAHPRLGPAKTGQGRRAETALPEQG